MDNLFLSKRNFLKTLSLGALLRPGLTTAAANEGALNWIEKDGVVYGSRADSRGKEGGGPGYGKIVTGGDYTVTDLDSLIEASKKAVAGETIFIPDETEIDFSVRIYIEKLVISLAEGVTLAGNRGLRGSRGALLFSDAFATPAMIQALGPKVRITGLRLRGPHPHRYIEHHTRSFSKTAGLGRDYYYKFPVSRGIIAAHPQLEVDNCDISCFAHAGVSLQDGDGHHIHHNFIHQCQYQGLGYGVVHDTASSLIECNLFDENRHSIAGTGKPGCGYTARNNVEMGVSLSHCFDMHGGRDRKDQTNIAGTRIEIYNNTFRSHSAAVVIRGEPEDSCQIHHNWILRFPSSEGAFRGELRTRAWQNAFGETTVRIL